VIIFHEIAIYCADRGQNENCCLEAELTQSDFAVITLTPDNHSDSRGQMSMAPRDNVLFELGLFMGHLGRERTYFICDRKQDLKIPTDLLGVNPASYERREGQDLGEAVATACSSIAKRMRELDVRPKRAPKAENENRLVSRFCERIAGTWWGRQSSEEEMRLSLLRITPDYEANTVQLDGDTFDRNGKLFGKWKSVAIGIRVKERILFFSWEGRHPTLSPGDIFHGFGQYEFEDAFEIYDRGTGLFADLHLGHKKAPLWKSVDLRRVDMADLDRMAQVMRNGSDNARASEAMKALDRFRGSGG
jgi:Predicted nucleotide-binding protein containing TIR-like domain